MSVSQRSANGAWRRGLAFFFCLGVTVGLAQEVPDAATEESTPSPPVVHAFPAPQFQDAWALKPLKEKGGIWIDLQRKAVVVRGDVTLREGPLEMFACPRGTKEYESIVAVDCLAVEVHAALLAIGLTPGKPVSFRPEYRPVSGPEVAVEVRYRQGESWRQVPAGQWVREVKTGESLSHPWVFGGSGEWTDPETGEKYYYAEGGELICVSNFSTATLDLPIASPQDNQNLWFEPFTERIPELGTEVYLILTAAKPPSDKPRP